MTRDLVTDETRAQPSAPGSWTRNIEVPEDYEGKVVIVAALRLGDHAHLIVYTGRQAPGDRSLLKRETRHYGRAGGLTVAWHFWEWIRGLIDAADVPVAIKEVEHPTREQLKYHLEDGH